MLAMANAPWKKLFIDSLRYTYRYVQQTDAKAVTF